MTIQLPLDQTHPIRPPDNLRDLQVQGPVHRVRSAVGDPAWLVTGYRELQELFLDTRLGRSHPQPDTAARWGDSMLHGGPQGNYATEPEDHARFRARVQPHFSPRRMRELRPRVEALTTELIDQLAASQPPADLTQALALPLPIPGTGPGQSTACSACTNTASGLSPASTRSQVMTSSPAGAQTRRCPMTRRPCWR